MKIATHNEIDNWIQLHKKYFETTNKIRIKSTIYTLHINRITQITNPDTTLTRISKRCTGRTITRSNNESHEPSRMYCRHHCYLSSTNEKWFPKCRLMETRVCARFCIFALSRLTRDDDRDRMRWIGLWNFEFQKREFGVRDVFGDLICWKEWSFALDLTIWEVRRCEKNVAAPLFF